MPYTIAYNTCYGCVLLGVGTDYNAIDEKKKTKSSHLFPVVQSDGSQGFFLLK